MSEPLTSNLVAGAPERREFAHHDSHGYPVTTEYVRADLYERLTAELKESREHAGRMLAKQSRLASEKDRLRAALKKYGHHIGHCRFLRHDESEPCRCGYTASLAGAADESLARGLEQARRQEFVPDPRETQGMPCESTQNDRAQPVETDWRRRCIHCGLCPTHGQIVQTGCPTCEALL